MGKLLNRQAIPLCVAIAVAIMLGWRWVGTVAPSATDSRSKGGTATPEGPFFIKGVEVQSPKNSPETPPSEGEFALRVFVQDSTGRPIPGALVRFEVLGEEGAVFGLEAYGPEIRTDERGVARLKEKLPPFQASPFEQIQVLASKQGWAKADALIELPQAGMDRDVTVTMNKASVIVGKVVGFHPGTHDDIGIHARITTSPELEGAAIAQWVAAMNSMETFVEIDAEGNFRIDDLAQIPIEIKISSLLYEADVVVVTPPRDDLRIAVHSAPEIVRLRLNVVADGLEPGQESRSASVLFVRMDEGNEESHESSWTRIPGSDKFDLDVGDYRMVSGYDPGGDLGGDGLWVIPESTFSLRPGPPLDIEVRAIRGARLDVCISGDPSGERLAVQCGVYSSNGKFLHVVEDREHSNGLIQFGGLSPGQWVVRAVREKNVLNEQVVELKSGELVEVRW